MIPTIAQIIATHQPDTRPDNIIDGCIACPDTTHTTWEQHANHVATAVRDTYRIDVAADLQSLPDGIWFVDSIGNIDETQPMLSLDVEVEFPVWILPRIDQMEVEQ